MARAEEDFEIGQVLGPQLYCCENSVHVFDIGIISLCPKMPEMTMLEATV